MTATRTTTAPASRAAIWAMLARARVLVRISALGPDDPAGGPRGRFGWLECLRQLERACAADRELLRRVHTVAIDAGSRPEARVTTSEPGGPVELELRFAVRVVPLVDRPPSPATGARAVSKEVMVPDAAEIATSMSRLGPRPRIDTYEFDNRFPLFLARLGLGLEVAKPYQRDGTGTPAFQTVLRQYGERVAGLLAARKGPRGPGSLPQWRRALGSAVDARFHPQLKLLPRAAPDAGFEVDRSASFPGSPPHDVYAFIAYALESGKPVVLSLDEIEACAGRLLKRWTPPGSTVPRRGQQGACTRPGE